MHVKSRMPTLSITIQNKKNQSRFLRNLNKNLACISIFWIRARKIMKALSNPLCKDLAPPTNSHFRILRWKESLWLMIPTRGRFRTFQGMNSSPLFRKMMMVYCPRLIIVDKKSWRFQIFWTRIGGKDFKICYNKKRMWSIKA
jgi:hypothetical protein